MLRELIVRLNEPLEQLLISQPKEVERILHWMQVLVQEAGKSPPNKQVIVMACTSLEKIAEAISIDASIEASILLITSQIASRLNKVPGY
jgi:hypothetical protein